MENYKIKLIRLKKYQNKKYFFKKNTKFINIFLELRKLRIKVKKLRI